MVLSKNIVFLLFFISLCWNLEGQNLFPNPSFEDTIQCLDNGHIDNVDQWFNPTLATPDYFNSCTTGNFGVPVNAYGNQTARTGQAYTGIVSIINSSGWREYLQVELTSPLVMQFRFCCST